MLNKADETEWEALRSADFSSPAAVAALPLTERWIVSLLHQVGGCAGSGSGGGGGAGGEGSGVDSFIEQKL